MCLILTFRLTSANGSPVKSTYYSTLNSPRSDLDSIYALKTYNKIDSRYTDRNQNHLRDTNSASETIESLQNGIIADRTQRYSITQEKDKFLHRIIKKLSNDDVNSRVSTIDTNTITKKSNGTPETYTPVSNSDDQNFLVSSHKRTKQKPSRYFNDERISLPMIKSNSEINKKIPFGVKRISCSKNIKRCFVNSNPHNSNEDNQVLSDNYYMTVENNSVLKSLQEFQIESNTNHTQKHRTRNIPCFSQRNTEKTRQSNEPNHFDKGVLSQDYGKFNKIFSRLCECTVNGIKCTWKSLYSTNKNIWSKGKLIPMVIFKSQIADSQLSSMENESNSLTYENCSVYQGKSSFSKHNLGGANINNIPATPSFSQRQRN